METVGARNDSAVENIGRSTRRARTNKSITIKFNETKDQENVNNSSLVQNTETTPQQEVTKNNASDEKVLAASANINSSTPRRKKDPLANLYSNLSPKYIGFTTPPNQLNSSTEEGTRSLRKRHNYSHSANESCEDFNDKDIDIIFTPNTEGTLGFVRRTPRNNELRVTPDDMKRKKFVSPIDKLLIKNGAVMELNHKLPVMNCNGIVSNSEVPVTQKELDEKELGVKEFDIYDEETKRQKIEFTSFEIDVGKCKRNVFEKSKSNKIASYIKKTAVHKEYNNFNIKSESKETTAMSNESKVDDKEERDDISISTGVAEQLIDDIESSEDQQEEFADDFKVYNTGRYNEMKNKSSGKLSSIDKQRTANELEDLLEILTDTEETEALQVEMSLNRNITPKAGETKIKLVSNNKVPETASNVAELEHLNNVVENKSSQSLRTVETAKILKSRDESKDSVIKIEAESVDNENHNEFIDAPSATANSPSAVSMDSAKGSSIVNEGAWMSFTTGDLYWGQIYSFCYWPCMVCPDPDGKTIATEETARSGDQTVVVHVRFFADNGRRNWVKQDNLMPFTGLENYKERLVEVREKYGTKSAKYKLYVPPKRKEQIWFVAVNEADIIAETAYANRLEKFFEIFEKSRAFQKRVRQHRKSMYIPLNSGTGSDIESYYGSTDNINSLSLAALMKTKRERSISPYSPAYSPIKSLAAKRRKLSAGDHDDLNASSSKRALHVSSTDEYSNNAALSLSQANSVASLSSAASSINDLDLYNSLEFRKLYAYMKDYVMEENQDENLEKSLVVAVRNIWALRQINRRQIERKLQDSLTETDTKTSPSMTKVRSAGEGSVKRLSSRLKNLTVRKSLMAQQNLDAMSERAETPKPVANEADKVKKPMNRPILEVIDDIFNLDSKYLFKGMTREPVCKYCLKPGLNLRKCAKNCSYWLHRDCLYKDFNEKARRRSKALNGTKISKNGSLNSSQSSSLVNLSEVESATHVTGDSQSMPVDIVCKECANNEPPKCMVCNCTESKKENDSLVKCSMAQCERSFHPGCCKYWPQAKLTISKNVIESFRCPSHVCHTCVSDDPKGKFQHLSNAKLTKCVMCPATFHTDSTCIPAGSQIITAAHVICPRHLSVKHDMTVNVNWCFICVGGGQLMCCETCPTAVHANCLKIPIAPNEGYICEECESGRMPLYGEMVWAKFNNFRWWPAIILPPTEVPKNIARKTHNPSDFVVRFFGTHDHGWISRRRVYIYLEGDSSEPPRTKSNLDLSYNRGIAEAKEVYEIIKAKKLQQRNSNENKEKLHPQPYVRIKANRPVPPVKLHVHIESVSKCECDAREENPCGADTNCLNRVLYHECNPKMCPAGERCQNQMFESRVSPRLDVVYMKERGFGLVCREPIKAGSFIIEYVGEIINDNEFQARMQQKSRDRDENFYFLSVEKDYIIDAGPKGNLARFMNHSCDPNCETQKWCVNSLNRVGLFAIKDIPENTELTFNYHWDDLLGNEKKTCYCGAQKCAGQIGAKMKDLETSKLPPAVIETAKTKVKSKPKSKLQSRPNKKLLNKKLATKLKQKAKTKQAVTKRVRAAGGLAKSAKSTSGNADKSLAEDSETNAEASTSRLLESPDIFA